MSYFRVRFLRAIVFIWSSSSKTLPKCCLKSPQPCIQNKSTWFPLISSSPLITVVSSHWIMASDGVSYLSVSVWATAFLLAAYLAAFILADSSRSLRAPRFLPLSSNETKLWGESVISYGLWNTSLFGISDLLRGLLLFRHYWALPSWPIQFTSMWTNNTNTL